MRESRRDCVRVSGYGRSRACANRTSNHYSTTHCTNPQPPPPPANDDKAITETITSYVPSRLIFVWMLKVVCPDCLDHRLIRVLLSWRRRSFSPWWFVSCSPDGVARSHLDYLNLALLTAPLVLFPGDQRRCPLLLVLAIQKVLFKSAIKRVH